MGFVSYADDLEDVLLHRALGELHAGFYVDLGAADPVRGSVTKAFYDRGWSGINAVPAAQGEAFAQARPRDINLALSAADSLAAILARHRQERPVAFLRIVAATELGAADWRAVRPSVLLVKDRPALEASLRAQSYVAARVDGVNRFYVPEERRDLVQHFARPAASGDGYSRFDPADAALRERLEAALARAAAAEAERDRMQSALQHTTRENLRLVAQQSAHLDAIRAHGDAVAEMRRQNEREIALTLELDGKRHAAALREQEQANAELRRTVQLLAAGPGGAGLRDAVARLEAGMQTLLGRPAQAAPAAAADPAVTEELRRLGRMLESTLMTLALDAARPAWPGHAAVPPQ